MPDLSPTIDAVFLKIGQSWANTGDDGVTANSISTTFTADASFLLSIDLSAFNAVQIERGAIEFDTSGITETPTSATIKLHGTGTTDSAIKIIGVEADFATDGAIVKDDFDSWNEASPVNYTDVLNGSDWNNDAYNTFTLTDAAKAAMVSQDVIQIIWLEFDNDYDRASAGSGNVDLNVGACGRSNSDASKRPVLSYEVPITTGPVKLEGGSRIQVASGKFFIGIK